MFPSFNVFKQARAWMHKMIEYGLWEAYELYCGKHCVYSDTQIDWTVLMTLNSMTMKLLGPYFEFHCVIDEVRHRITTFYYYIVMFGVGMLGMFMYYMYT